jgi:hypothetical protein
MSAAANKDVVRRSFEELWNQGRNERAEEFYTQDVVLTDPTLPVPKTGLDAARMYREI